MIRDFESRHIGPREEEVKPMLQKIGVSSIDELIDKTVPAGIRLKKPIELDAAMTEFEYLNHIQSVANKNKIYKKREIKKEIEIL